MVLRVANARALIIDLRRLWYLQWITTQTDSDNCAIIRVSDYIACTLLVMALKATAWCRVLIAQFEEYFDAALAHAPGLVIDLRRLCYLQPVQCTRT